MNESLNNPAIPNPVKKIFGFLIFGFIYSLFYIIFSNNRILSLFSSLLFGLMAIGMFNRKRAAYYFFYIYLIIIIYQTGGFSLIYFLYDNSYISTKLYIAIGVSIKLGLFIWAYKLMDKEEVKEYYSINET